MKGLIERIERQAGVPGLAAILAARLAPTDLQSLLLEVYRRRSARRTPAEVLADYRSDRFVRPSAAPPARLLDWQRLALARLPAAFDTVALAPVCPLGTSAAVAGVDQNWSVATSRNTEVVSDATNVLALECAVRRRRLLRAAPKSPEEVHLATEHRLLRAQHYHDPDLLAHFSLLALCSAGRDRGGLEFELAAIALHLRFYLDAVRAFVGPEVPLRLTVTDFGGRAPRRALLEARLLAPIREAFGGVACGFDDERTAGRGYYADLCFHLYGSAGGRERLLVDGGAVDWTQKLLSNAKERLVVSGIGSERLCSEFAGSPAGAPAGDPP